MGDRAGIDGCLHRISAMRDKTGAIYGLTLRVGRAIYGNTKMMEDILMGEREPSVLILGRYAQSHAQSHAQTN